MTVGIATIFNQNGEKPGIILVADRMITVEPITFEHVSSKIQKIVDQERFKVYGIGSGELSLITEFFVMLKERIEEFKDGLPTYKAVADLSTKSFNQIARQRVENRAMGPLGYTLSGARDIADIFKDNVARMAFEELDRIWRELWALIAVVDQSGCHLLTLGKSTINYSDKLGYELTGSGTESAEWSLIHRHFDPTKSKEHAVFMALWAKFQAEESEGVGTDTDGKILQLGEETKNLDFEMIKRVRSVTRSIHKREMASAEKSISEITL